VDPDPESFLEPAEIADVLEFALKQRSSVNIHNIKIQPRLHKIKKSRKENENN
jgi:NADP-dependent 3-hydroxy acid dehydrogenase YdfG